MRVLQRGAGGDFVEDRLEAALAQTRLSPADRHLCQELAYGIVRWQATLDWLIARKTDSRAQKPLLQNLLRLGLYQIFWLDRIPNHAAVHETVELARQSGFRSAGGLRQCRPARLPARVRRHQASAGRTEDAQPHLGLFPSRMAGGALASALGRRPRGAVDGVEQHPAESVRPRQHPQGRPGRAPRPVARRRCGI